MRFNDAPNTMSAMHSIPETHTQSKSVGLEADYSQHSQDRDPESKPKRLFCAAFALLAEAAGD
jgi:hypothetical protein